ncbi:MAG: cation transporter [Coriobacteriia bacterium]|nr:cation transporter [Coriobacteriia bacterium]MBN2839505.1 cation transporter [Coriobacteriia bacterium]
MAGHGGSKTAVIAAVIGNLIIAIIKFIAAAITGSSAMISEGIHSLVDTGNGGLLLHGMSRAKIPADEGHPFGHGKALYFWTLVVSVSIFGIGGGMSLYEGISHIRHVAPGAELSDPTVNYIVLAIAMVVEGWSFSVALREFIKAKGTQKSWAYIRGAKDPSTFTIVLEDSAAMAGLVFAFLGVFFGHMLGNPYLDGAASIIIGVILMSVAFVLAWETKGLLLGEGVDAKTLADMRARIMADPAVSGVGDILTMYMGPYELLVNLGVRFAPGTSIEETHEAIQRIEAELSAAYPQCTRIYIEAESLKQGVDGNGVSA